MPKLIKQDIIDQIAIELGAKQAARLQWRARGVPAKWRIAIYEQSRKQGKGLKMADFDDWENK